MLPLSYLFNKKDLAKWFLEYFTSITTSWNSPDFLDAKPDVQEQWFNEKRFV